MSSLSEPFLLGRYGVPKQRLNGVASIYTTQHSSDSLSDGYLTVTSQGEGIQIHDVSST
jgi:hypothetical protein